MIHGNGWWWWHEGLVCGPCSTRAHGRSLLQWRQGKGKGLGEELEDVG